MARTKLYCDNCDLQTGCVHTYSHPQGDDTLCCECRGTSDSCDECTEECPACKQYVRLVDDKEFCEPLCQSCINAAIADAQLTPDMDRWHI